MPMTSASTTKPTTMPRASFDSSLVSGSAGTSGAGRLEVALVGARGGVGAELGDLVDGPPGQAADAFADRAEGTGDGRTGTRRGGADRRAATGRARRRPRGRRRSSRRGSRSGLVADGRHDGGGVQPVGGWSSSGMTRVASSASASGTPSATGRGRAGRGWHRCRMPWTAAAACRGAPPATPTAAAPLRPRGRLRGRVGGGRRPLRALGGRGSAGTTGCSSGVGVRRRAATRARPRSSPATSAASGVEAWRARDGGGGAGDRAAHDLARGPRRDLAGEVTGAGRALVVVEGEAADGVEVAGHARGDLGRVRRRRRAPGGRRPGRTHRRRAATGR